MKFRNSSKLQNPLRGATQIIVNFHEFSMNSLSYPEFFEFSNRLG